MSILGSPPAMASPAGGMPTQTIVPPVLSIK